MKYIAILSNGYRVTVPSIIMPNKKRRYIQKFFAFKDLELAKEFRDEYLKEIFGGKYKVALLQKRLPICRNHISKTKRTERNGTKTNIIVGRIKIHDRLYTFSRSLEKYSEEKATELVRHALDDVQMEQLGYIIDVNYSMFER